MAQIINITADFTTGYRDMVKTCDKNASRLLFSEDLLSNEEIISVVKSNSD